MTLEEWVVALVATSLLLAGCSGPGGTPSDASSAASTVARVPLSLVVIGDSIAYNSPDDCPGCTGFVTQFATSLARATGREVTTTNRSKHTGLTLPGLMQDLPGLQAELSAADAIIVGIAHNSFPLSDDAPCGSRFNQATSTLEDWSKVGMACAEAAVTKYRPIYDDLFSTVASWRGGRPTILLALNKYNDWNGWGPAHLTPEEVKVTVDMHDAWDAMLCHSAQDHGVECADIYHAFNGPDGSRPAGALLASDYTHPSQKGNDEIARLLTERGFAPLTN